MTILTLQSSCLLLSDLGPKEEYKESVSGAPDCVCSERYQCLQLQDNTLNILNNVTKVLLYTLYRLSQTMF